MSFVAKGKKRRNVQNQDKHTPPTVLQKLSPTPLRTPLKPPHTQRFRSNEFRSDRNRSQPLLAGRWPPLAPPPQYIHKFTLRFRWLYAIIGGCIRAFTLSQTLPPLRFSFTLSKHPKWPLPEKSASWIHQQQQHKNPYFLLVLLRGIGVGKINNF